MPSEPDTTVASPESPPGSVCRRRGSRTFRPPLRSWRSGIEAGATPTPFECLSACRCFICLLKRHFRVKQIHFEHWKEIGVSRKYPPLVKIISFLKIFHLEYDFRDLRLIVPFGSLLRTLDFGACLMHFLAVVKKKKYARDLVSN